MIRFICSYFNFANSTKIKQNYIKFRRHFPYPITTVEIALSNRGFFIDDSIKILANETNVFWQKERCLNIAIDSLPDNTETVAWIDTDVIFHNRNFLRDTEKALEDYKVVQMFEKCRESPVVNAFYNNISIGNKLVNNIDIKFPAIGFAWAFHKNILIDNQLYDKDPVGNSDVLQLLTWLGIWNHQTIIDLHRPYRKEFLLWAWNSYEKVQANIGYTPGTLEHLYHGKYAHRQYLTRNNMLTEHRFLPSKDLELDKETQLYHMQNTRLRQDIFRYLLNRAAKE